VVDPLIVEIGDEGLGVGRVRGVRKTALASERDHEVAVDRHRREVLAVDGPPFRAPVVEDAVVGGRRGLILERWRDDEARVRVTVELRVIEHEEDAAGIGRRGDVAVLVRLARREDVNVDRSGLAHDRRRRIAAEPVRIEDPLSVPFRRRRPVVAQCEVEDPLLHREVVTTQRIDGTVISDPREAIATGDLGRRRPIRVEGIAIAGVDRLDDLGDRDLSVGFAMAHRACHPTRAATHTKSHRDLLGNSLREHDVGWEPVERQDSETS